jgi:hypothetical protein
MSMMPKSVERFSDNHEGKRRPRMTRKQRRLTMIGGSLAVLAVAAALVLNAMRDSIVFFSTPSMAAEKHIPPASGSGSAAWCSRARWCAATIWRSRSASPTAAPRLPVSYKGILPDLFREGQGVVAEGALDAPACSRPTPCWPSTTRPTCPRKSPTR